MNAKQNLTEFCNGVKKDFSVECGLKDLVFRDMTIRENECTAVFQIQGN